VIREDITATVREEERSDKGIPLTGPGRYAPGVSDKPDNADAEPENHNEDDFVEFDYTPNYTAVPEAFHSFTEEGPFSKCTLCEGQLLEDGTPYLIHKAFHRSEVIFEYAMCLPCRAKMQEELSAESLERINAYMDRYDIEDRGEALLEEHGTEVAPWISHCLISGKPIEGEDEYHYYAFCDGPDLVFNGLPMALAGGVDEELNELLSKQTRDRLDGFVDEQFGLPPELRKPIKGSPILI